MSSISTQRLDFLFRPPTMNPVIPGLNSTVHLVRREVQETLANITQHHPEDAFPGSHELHRVFASSILICSAIDLMGKFCNGDEVSNAENFRRTLMKYGGLKVVETRRVYNARNALTHSFGVVVVKPPPRARKGLPKRLRFVSSVRIQLALDEQTGPVLRVAKRHWQIGVPNLYRLMVRIVNELESDLRTTKDPARIALFNKMFMRYGRITIR